MLSDHLMSEGPLGMSPGIPSPNSGGQSETVCTEEYRDSVRTEEGKSASTLVNVPKVRGPQLEETTGNKQDVDGAPLPKWAGSRLQRAPVGSKPLV